MIAIFTGHLSYRQQGLFACHSKDELPKIRQKVVVILERCYEFTQINLMELGRV